VYDFFILCHENASVSKILILKEFSLIKIDFTLNKKITTYMSYLFACRLIRVVDWLPTIVAAAGGTVGRDFTVVVIVK